MVEATAVQRVTPTASMPVRVPWGHWVAQALEHETTIVEATAGVGVNLALGALPMGAVIRMFIGPQVVKEYVDMGLSALEGVVDPMALTVDSSNTLLTTVVNLINKSIPSFAGVIGDQLEPMVKVELAKLGVHT